MKGSKRKIVNGRFFEKAANLWPYEGGENSEEEDLNILHFLRGEVWVIPMLVTACALGKQDNEMKVQEVVLKVQ